MGDSAEKASEEGCLAERPWRVPSRLLGVSCRALVRLTRIEDVVRLRFAAGGNKYKHIVMQQHLNTDI